MISMVYYSPITGLSAAVIYRSYHRLNIIYIYLNFVSTPGTNVSLVDYIWCPTMFSLNENYLLWAGTSFCY